MGNKLGFLLVLGVGGLYAEHCRPPRKNCSKVSVDIVSGELRKQMSSREGARSQVSVLLGSGKGVTGIVSAWSDTDISVGARHALPQNFAPTEIKRVSIQRKSNRLEKGITAVLLSVVFGVVGIFATPESGVGGPIGMGAGAAIGIVAVGRAKTVEYEVQ